MFQRCREPGMGVVELRAPATGTSRTSSSLYSLGNPAFKDMSWLLLLKYPAHIQVKFRHKSLSTGAYLDVGHFHKSTPVPTRWQQNLTSTFWIFLKVWSQSGPWQTFFFFFFLYCRVVVLTGNHSCQHVSHPNHNSIVNALLIIHCPGLLLTADVGTSVIYPTI